MQDLSAQNKLRKVSVILFVDLVFPIPNSEKLLEKPIA